MATFTKGKRAELAPVISNFLFHSLQDPQAAQKEYVELKIKIREYLNYRGLRKIIAQILYDLERDVAGETRERLFKLYKELGLHHDAYQKLESWRWETVAQGILELSQMEVAESHLFIKKFINDRRGVIRKQAELATVSLCEDGINYVLDTTKHPISEWQQLKLIEILGKRKDYKPPQFKGWLLSSNNDVVLFALRLIKHYNQVGAETSIKQLVKHKDDEVKLAALHCIADFNFYGSLGLLKTIFWQSSHMVKMRILDTIALLGSPTDISFLRQVAQTEKNYFILSKAQSTINTFAPESILPTKDIQEVAEDDALTAPVMAADQEIKTSEELAEASAFTVVAAEDFYDETAFTPQEKEEPATSLAKTETPIQITEEAEASATIIEEPAYIEVEDIEFYDEVAFPGKGAEEIEAVASAPEPAMAFELKDVAEAYGTALDQEMAAVTAIDKTPEGKEDFWQAYTQMAMVEKRQLIQELDNLADDRQLFLLEQIAENEIDTELRFMAFKKLQNPKLMKPTAKATQLAAKAEALPDKENSVFYALFHYTDDLDAKLVLLQQIIEIGDHKEIPFVESLLVDQVPAITKKAKETLAVLQERQQNLAVAPRADWQPTVGEKPEQAKPALKEERIPMEFFMLQENQHRLQQEQQKPHSALFDFELSDDFFAQGQQNATNTGARA